MKKNQYRKTILMGLGLSLGVSLLAFAVLAWQVGQTEMIWISSVMWEVAGIHYEQTVTTLREWTVSAFVVAALLTVAIFSVLAIELLGAGTRTDWDDFTATLSGRLKQPTAWEGTPPVEVTDEPKTVIHRHVESTST